MYYYVFDCSNQRIINDIRKIQIYLNIHKSVVNFKLITCKQTSTS